MIAETLDPNAILAALGRTEPAQAVPVTGGADTTLWHVAQGDRHYALRVFRAEQVAVCRREVAAMAAAAKGGLPVPAVHAEGVWQDRPALLLSWLPGWTLAEEMRVRPWHAWAMGVRFGRMQAAIHEIAAPGKLDAAGSWLEWAEPDAALRHCLLAHARGSRVLLHLDYHPLNVLVDQGDVSAVLDWANARAGDPRADLARTASILRFAPLDPSLPFPAPGAVRRVFIAGWRRGYREAAGAIGGMAPFFAWAGEVMARDLSPRLGRSDLPWLTPAFLARVRAWTAEWRARAGCRQ